MQTRDILYNRPYYIISYFDENDDKRDKEGKPLEHHKWVAHNALMEFVDDDFARLIKTVKSLEKLHEEYEALEIEFKLVDGEVSISKVDKLKEIDDVPRVMSERDFNDTKSIAKCSYLDKHYMLSDNAIWNTIRLLGDNPRPFEYSVFRELTDMGTWNTVVKEMGYEGCSLDMIVKVGNKPYVSLTNLCAGLVPNGLDQMIKYKLENYYEQACIKCKEDGINFEHNALLSSFEFNIDSRLEKLKNYNFTEDEIIQIKDAMYAQTKYVVDNYEQKSCENFEKILLLRTKLEEILSSNPLKETNAMKLNKYISELVTDIRNYAVRDLIFEERCVSIAQKFYQALANEGKDNKAVLFSLSKQLWSNVRTKDNYKAVFDVRSRVQGVIKMRDELRGVPDVDLNVLEPMLEKGFADGKYGFDSHKLAEFIKNSIARDKTIIEIFINAVSLVTDMAARLGEVLGIAYEDVSYLEIPDLIDYHSRDSYIQVIHERRKMYHANTYIKLPSVIYNVGDIDIIDED